MHPLTLLVALMIACLSWIHAGTRLEHLGMIPWLAFTVFAMTFVRPQRKRGESPGAARDRAARAVFRDPVFYAFGVLLAVLWLQNLNAPRDAMPIAPGEPLLFHPPPWEAFPPCGRCAFPYPPYGAALALATSVPSPSTRGAS